MASSIKISDHTKRSLDKLLASILLRYDIKLTQQEALELLIEYGEKNLDLLLLARRKPVEGITKRIRGLQKPWDIETSPEMIDEVLYGEKGQ